MTCHVSLICWVHARYFLADRRRAAPLAGLPADAGPADGRAEPTTAGRIRPVPSRLRGAGAPQRRAGFPAAPVRAAASPRVAAEPTVPPPRPDAAPRTRRPRGVRFGWARCLRHAHRSRSRRHQCCRTPTRRHGPPLLFRGHDATANRHPDRGDHRCPRSPRRHAATVKRSLCFMPFDRTQERLARVDGLEDDRAFLIARAEHLAERYDEVVFALDAGIIHADANVGNLLRTRDGAAVLADLDGFATGAREWDLLQTAM